MSRTFTAGAVVDAPQPQPDPDDDILRLLNDPETRMWQLIRELWELGERYHPLAVKTATLRRQLADPTLATHPKAAEARERLAKRQATLDHIDAEARLICDWFMTIWRRMPEQRRHTLQSQPGWPRPSSVARVSGELWMAAKNGRPFPPGGAPF